MRRISSKKRRKINIRKSLIFPMIYEAYSIYSGDIGFCAKCSVKRIPGHLDMHEPGGHGGVHGGLKAEYDPEKIEFRCCIELFGNECPPSGPDRLDYLELKHPKLKRIMIEMSNGIKSHLKMAGQMIATDDEVVEAIKEYQRMRV